MNLLYMLFGKPSSGKKTRKMRYNGKRYNKSYKKTRYHIKHNKSRKNKYIMKGGRAGGQMM